MWCQNCNNHLSNCECPDLPTRIDALKNSVIFSPEVLKQAERVRGMNELKNVGKKDEQPN